MDEIVSKHATRTHMHQKTNLHQSRFYRQATTVIASKSNSPYRLQTDKKPIFVCIVTGRALRLHSHSHEYETTSTGIRVRRVRVYSKHEFACNSNASRSHMS